MAIHCVNTNSKEFKDLTVATNINPIKLAATIAEWQQRNSTDSFPTITDLQPSILESQDITPEHSNVLNYIVKNFNNNKPLKDGFFGKGAENSLGEIRQMLRRNGLIDAGFNVTLADEGRGSLYLTRFDKKYVPKLYSEDLSFKLETLNSYTNHSGGAVGSDTQWDVIGKEFGMITNKHYYFEGFKTPNGNTAIPIELKKEADEKLKAANKTLGRKFPTSKEYVNNLLRRNWWQVKNSDAIFAIATITDNKVDGGTGWAVHMAIAENKPVYVFDQKINKWFTWNNNKFIESAIPRLTKNFAGIGTREINESGKQAIRNVYEASIKQDYKSITPTSTLTSTPQLELNFNINQDTFSNTDLAGEVEAAIRHDMVYGRGKSVGDYDFATLNHFNKLLSYTAFTIIDELKGLKYKDFIEFADSVRERIRNVLGAHINGSYKKGELQLNTEQIALIKELLDSIKDPNSEIWKNFVNYFSGYYNIIIEDFHSVSEETDGAELPTHWDDTAQLRLDNRRSISAKVKFALSSVVHGKNEITGLWEVVDLDTLIGRLINAHVTDVTNEEFQSRLDYIVQNEYPGLASFAQMVKDDENLMSAYKSALNFDVAEVFALVSNKYVNQNTIFDILRSNRDSFVQARDFDLWLRNINVKIGNKQLGFLNPIAKKVIAKFKDNLDEGYTRITIEDIMSAITGEKVVVDYSPEFFNTLTTILKEVGIAIPDNALLAEYQSERYNNPHIPNKNKQFIKDVLDPIGYILGDIARAVNKGLNKYTTDQRGTLYNIAGILSGYSNTKTQLDYYNVNKDVVYTPIYQSHISRLFKGINNVKTAYEKFKPYTTIERFQHSNILWNTNGVGIFNFEMVDGRKVINENNPVNLNFTRALKPYFFNGINMISDSLGLEYSKILNKNWDLVRLLSSTQGYYYIHTADAGRIAALKLDFKWDSNLINTTDSKQASGENIGLLFDEEGEFRGIKPNTPVFNLIKNTILQEVKEMRDAANKLFHIENGSITGEKGINTNTLQAPKHWDGKALHNNGVPTGRVFQFNNLTYRTFENGKYVVNTLGDTLSLNEVLSESDESLLTNDKINNFIQEAINANIKEQIRTFKALEDIATRQQTYTKAGDESTETVDKNKPFKDTEAFNKGVAAYYINNYLAQVEYGNFILGTQDEYKGIDDLNKRASQAIKNGLTSSATTQYRSVTSANVMMASPFINYLKSIIPDYADAYNNIDSTDGITIITLEEFKTRLRGYGRYDNYKDLIEKLERNEPLNPLEYQNLIESQKYFYYERTPSDRGNGMGTNVLSQQYKNSTIIISEKLSKGTQLEALHEWMEANQVDEVSFASAKKVGDGTTIKLFENGKFVAPTNFDSSYINLRNHSDLVVQLDVVPHAVDEINKFGTQLEKQILANIDYFNKIYKVKGIKGKLNGEQIKTHFHNLINANVSQSAISLLHEFGAVKNNKIVYKLDENGKATETIDVDPQKVIKYLQDYVEKNETSYALREAIKSIDGTTALPLYNGLTYAKFTSILLSLFNNHVINQRIPGIHAAIVPELGLAPYQKLTDQSAEYEQLVADNAIDFADDFVKRGDYKLAINQLPTGEKGDMIMAEIILPAWSKKLYKGGELISINDLSEDARTMFGIRIPTEGKQSTVYVKVVGFLKSGASQVIAPYEFIAKTGWDFDIDSLYLYLKELTLNDEGKLDTVKFLDETTTIETRYQAYIHSLPEGRRIRIKYAHLIAKEFEKIKASKQWYNTRIINIETRAKELYVDDLYELYAIRSELYKELEAHKLDELSLTPSMVEALQFIRNQIGEVTAGIQFLKDGLDINIEEVDALRKARSKKLDARNETIQNYKDSRQQELEALVTIEEFGKMSIEEQNTRSARQARMIDILGSIVTNPRHIGEYYKPNGFNHITAVGDHVNRLLGYQLEGLNINNDFDSAKLRDLNMSVRNLKSNSVAWDGIMSILGVVGAEHLSIPIMLKESKYLDTLTPQQKALFKSVADVDGGSRVTVSHFANSPTKNWQDINGLFITEQSSEVTANILDAVKQLMGANINEATLSVFRLLSSNSLAHKFNGSPNRFVLPYFFTHQPSIIEFSQSLSIAKAENLNATKASVINQLIRDYEAQYTFLLLDDMAELLEGGKNHPLIVKLVANQNTGNIPYLDKDDFKLLKSIRSEALIKLDINTSFESAIPDVTDLEAEIITGVEIQNGNELNVKDKIQHLINQKYILQHFKQLDTIAGDIVKAISTFNTDKKGTGPTFNVTRQLLNNIEELMFNRSLLAIAAIEDGALTEYKQFIELFDNTHDIREKAELYKGFLEDMGYESGDFTTLRVGDISAVEAIYPMLFDNTKTVNDGAYPSLQNYLHYGNLMSMGAFQQFIPHEYGTLYDIRRDILRPLGLLFDNFAEKTVINYLNTIAVSSDRFFTLSNNSEILKTLTEHNTIGLTPDIVQRQLIYAPLNEAYAELNINTVNPTIEDVRKFNRQSLATKIKLLQGSETIQNILSDSRYAGSHVLAHIISEDSEVKFNDKGYFTFKLPNTVDPNYARQSINDMYNAEGTLGMMMRSVVEDMIKNHFYIHGISFGNNLSKHLDIKLLYEHTRNSEYQVDMSGIANTLRNNIEHGEIGKEAIELFFKAHWSNPKFVPVLRPKLTRSGRIKMGTPSFQTYGEQITGKPMDKINYDVAAYQIIYADFDQVNESPYASNEYVTKEINGEKVLYRRVLEGYGDSYIYAYYPIARTLPGEVGLSTVPKFNKFGTKSFIYTATTYSEAISKFLTEGNIYEGTHEFNTKYKDTAVLDEKRKAGEVFKDETRTVDITKTGYKVTALQDFFFNKGKTSLPLTNTLITAIEETLGEPIKSGQVIKLKDSNSVIGLKINRLLPSMILAIPDTVKAYKGANVSLTPGTRAAMSKLSNFIFAYHDAEQAIHTVAALNQIKETNYSPAHYVGNNIEDHTDGVFQVYIYTPATDMSINRAKIEINKLLKSDKRVLFTIDSLERNIDIVKYLLEVNAEFRVFTHNATDASFLNAIAEELGVNIKSLSNKILSAEPVLQFESTDLTSDTVVTYDDSTLDVIEQIAKNSDVSVYLGNKDALFNKQLKLYSGNHIEVDFNKTNKEIAEEISNAILSYGQVRTISMLGDTHTDLGLSQAEVNSRVSDILDMVNRRTYGSINKIFTINEHGIASAVRANTSNIKTKTFSHVNSKVRYNTNTALFSEELSLDGEILATKDYGDIQYMAEQTGILAQSLNVLAHYAEQYKGVPLPYKDLLTQIDNEIRSSDKYHMLTKNDINAINEALKTNKAILEPMLEHVKQLVSELDIDLNNQSVNDFGDKSVKEREGIAAKVRQLGHLLLSFEFIGGINTIDSSRGDETLIKLANQTITDLKAMYEDSEKIFTDASQYAGKYLHAVFMHHTTNPNYISEFSKMIAKARESGELILSKEEGTMTDQQLYDQYVNLLTKNEAMSWSILNMDSIFNTGIPFVDAVLKEYISARGNMNQGVNDYMDRFEILLKKYFGESINVSMLKSNSAFVNSFISDFINNSKTALRGEYDWTRFYQVKAEMWAEVSKSKDRIQYIDDQLLLNREQYEEGKITKEEYELKRDDLVKSYKAVKSQHESLYQQWAEDNLILDPEVTKLTQEEIDDLNHYKSVLTTQEFERYLVRKRIELHRDTEEYIKIVPKAQYKDQSYAALKDEQKKFLEEYKKLIQDILMETIPEVAVGDEFYPVLIKEKLTDAIKGSVGVRKLNTRQIVKGLGNELKYELDLPMVNFQKPEFNIRYDIKKATETQEEYEQRILKDINDKFGGRYNFTSIADIDAYNNEANQRNKEYAEAHREFNPMAVTTEFIKRAKHYHHIKGFENTLMLMLEQISSDNYKEDVTSGSGRRYVDKILTSITGQKQHQKLTGKHTTAYQRMISWLPAYYGVSNVNSKFDQGLSVARGFTSLVYMGGNILGGVKNVMKGYHDMLMESLAGQYVSRQDLNWATGAYTTRMVKILANLGKEYTDDLVVALMKAQPDLLELRDSSEHLVNLKSDPHKIYAALNNAVYFNMNSTEHFMQYSMYLGMLKSHRVVGGRAVSYTEFVGDVREALLKQVLNDEQLSNFETFKQKVNATKSRHSDFYDYVRMFAERRENMTNEQRKQYAELIKKEEKELKGKFDKYERVFDQFELMSPDGTRGKDGQVEGRAVLKEGSSLTQEAFDQLANKVQKVNHSMHGVYNRIDKMALRNKTIMDLALQFRSWVKPNWDRYMSKRGTGLGFSSKNLGRSVYSEGLGTYQKGIYISMWDFLVTPIRANKIYGKNDRNTLEAFRAILSDYAHFFANAAVFYRQLPIHERANIKKAAVNFSAIIGTSLGLVVLGALAKGDDDDKRKNIENKALALSIYQLNMLHSELTQFIPGAGWHGFYVRSKQYPLAAEKTFIDLWKLSTGIIKYPFQDDEARYYQTGAYKDRLRIEVLANKSMPIYRQVHKWQQLGMYTGWYKMYNPFGFMFGN